MSGSREQGRVFVKAATRERSSSKARTVARTHELRETRDKSELEDLLAEQDADPLDDNESDEEHQESNDISRDDSEAEVDVLRHGPAQVVARCLLPVRLRAHWRVVVTAGEVGVEPVAADPRTLDSEAHARRRAVLTLAARHQIKYLSTGNVEFLQVLSTNDLLSRISAEWPDRSVATVYETRQLDIASDVQSQFFYAPWGSLHAIRFLLQADVCGIAVARVWHALHNLVADEQSALHFLTDREVAAHLNERFGTDAFEAKTVARWREVDDEASRKRLYFPNREERAAICRQKRQSN